MVGSPEEIQLKKSLTESPTQEILKLSKLISLALSEPASSRGGQPGLYVWDTRASVCGHGEASWRHVGDDPVQWERPTSWEDHKVPGDTGDTLPQL